MLPGEQARFHALNIVAVEPENRRRQLARKEQEFIAFKAKYEAMQAELAHQDKT